jgi:hypothetical protein
VHFKEISMQTAAAVRVGTGVNEIAYRPGLLAGHIGERQFAEEIGKSLRTVRAWRKAGRGPNVVKIGNRVYYRRSAIDLWLREIEEDPSKRDGRRRVRGR